MSEAHEQILNRPYTTDEEVKKAPFDILGDKSPNGFRSHFFRDA